MKNITQEWSKIRVCHDHIVAGKDYFVSTYHCMVEKMGMSSDFVSDAPSQLWSCNHTIAKKYDTVIRLWIRYTPPQDHNCGPKSQKSVLLFGCYYKVLRVKPGTYIYIYIYVTRDIHQNSDPEKRLQGFLVLTEMEVVIQPINRNCLAVYFSMILM